MQQSDRLTYLFQQYLDKTCTRQEREELFQYISEAQNDQELKKQIEVTFNGKFLLHNQDHEQADLIFQNIIAAETQPSVRRMGFWKYAAAASIVLAVGVSSYFLLFNKIEKPSEIVTTSPKDVEAPKYTRAIITLADGRTVAIDSVTSGMLAQQSDVTVTKTANGKIVYGGNADEIVYNTLTNPRGSKVIDMQLADGSHVWLNAGSSVTYPIAFIGNERKVEITGEAYFEVAHDATKPFFVSKGDMHVQVFGTHFNVNAYEDESDIKITLLEGAVKVSNGINEGLLKPGQQARVATGSNPSASLRVISNADLETVMAWKNGLFSFDNADLPAVMRQLSRWYDIEIEYSGEVPDIRFQGEILKDLSLSQLLNGLGSSTRIHFKMEGSNKVIILLNKN
ncbi:FecR domain-containing protein [Agriterribacter sp.]|uniref:FecR family protein n=1 Tax=Agriterribacter sp. TaxID=2821509 RepID=UPI002CBC87F9|nr:FecR domain-containing protein [Agriterribacter sp.]HRO46012.1 DUF4974 domain-containing protein [Agriterribacter sp.]HRQ17048.1 DUF4974 domain-containing protein [Agriterribacter sp.]